MKQLISHMVGDYLLQSNWMAANKAKDNKAAAAHAVMYTLAFLPHKPSAVSLVGIGTTHFLIDRFRLAKYTVYAKDMLRPDGLEELSEIVKGQHVPIVSDTGYPPGMPAGLATGLFIVADNTLHLMLNAFFLRRKDES